jgi:MtN3 and saliva related transmembrane protein
MLLKYFIEIVFSVGLFINALLFIPQIIKLYKTKDSEGLSLVTFVGFNLIQLFAVFHGYLHKDYLLMAGFLLSIITCGTVTIMIILYKKT